MGGALWAAKMTTSQPLTDIEDFLLQLGLIPPSWSSRMTDMESEKPAENEPPVTPLFKLINNRFFDLVISLCVLANLVFVVWETDMKAEDRKVPEWLESVMLCMTVLYCVELAIRLWALRCKFFSEQENMIDFVAVVVDLVILVVRSLPNTIPSMSILRIFRILRALRILRAVRTMYCFRELYMLLHGFMSAMRAIFWSTILLCLILTMWAVVAVEVIHPLNSDVAQTGVYDGCERCPRAFASVGASVVTLVQQIVAGDSWGVTSIPVLEMYPATATYFYAVILTVGLGALNLILTVIVDRAAQARQEDTRFLLQQRKHEFEKAKKSLLELCRTLDVDKDGTLTIDEIRMGFAYDDKFKEAMRILNIGEDDLDVLFSILDTDGSGEVCYDEFVEQLQRLKSTDTQIMLMFIRSSQAELKVSMQDFTKQMPAKMHNMSTAVEAIEKRLEKMESSLHGLLGEPEPKDSKDISESEEVRLLDRRSSSLMNNADEERLVVMQRTSSSMTNSMTNMGSMLANRAPPESEMHMKAKSCVAVTAKAHIGDPQQKEDLDQLKYRIRNKCVLILRELESPGGDSAGPEGHVETQPDGTRQFSRDPNVPTGANPASSTLSTVAFPATLATSTPMASGRSHWRQTKEDLRSRGQSEGWDATGGCCSAYQGKIHELAVPGGAVPGSPHLLGHV